MSKSALLHHQAHLWISDQTTLDQRVTQQLQQIFCKNNHCTSCSNCLQIQQKQHPCVIYAAAQNSYTLEDIDILLEQTKFKLGNNEHIFFILPNAQELTAACSNRLLKTIEEPYPGYHFILLATRTDTILPTIRSRCLVQEFKHQHQDFAYQEITQMFIDQNFANPLQFLKLIDKHEIDHHSSKDIVDALISHFYQHLQRLHKQPMLDFAAMNTQLDFLLLLKQQLAILPVQGSSKLFWKNMYLQFHQKTL